MLKKNLFLCLLLIFVFNLSSEEYENILPDEYEKNEFPLILRDLRRAEIIFIGSFPFSVLFTKIGIDLAAYAGSGFDRNYAPSIFGGSSSQPSGSSETKKILVTSLYVSGAITLTDFIISKYKAKKENEIKRNY